MPLPLLPSEVLDLTGLDRQGLLSRLQTLANQADSLWSDFSLSAPENIILEAQALLMSMACDTLNERARQLSLATVTDRLAIIRATRVGGFQLTGATAASVSGTFYLPNSALATKQVLLPIGTRLSSGDSQYTLYTASTIDAGNNASAIVTIENSEEEQEIFLSEETANIVMQLSRTPYVDDTVQVSAGNGSYSNRNQVGELYWSFLEMGPSDRGFLTMTDGNGKLYVLFGNDVNGSIPKGSIIITYRTGGGESSRVTASSAWKILDGIYDTDGGAVTVMFQNPTASVGGYDEMSVDEARVRAPLAQRVKERCVNEEDFEYVATKVAGIARAALVTSNHDSTIAEDTAKLYCVAYGTPYSVSGYYPPETPTAAQLVSVAARIAESGDEPALMGGVITTYAVTFLNVDIKVKIFKSSNTAAATVRANIDTELEKFFAIADDNRAANTKVDFGYKLLASDGTPDYKLAWSDIFNCIRDAEGVREISYAVDGLLLNTVRQSVILQPREFPRLGTVTVYDMDNSGVEI